ncbi:nucleoside phosphorylase domain protein [Fusarium sporotrichioides]|uniref:Nucleoside phosphorylase domain protein n=1 Tax=Fusarium sporotrichioides TaxID=5514 RepID=A0A395RDV3_FUSSP|nr:nucleoside phosphorylase domain protein [Fusarium sporotrichioides]
MAFQAPPLYQPSGSKVDLIPPPMSIDYRIAIICAQESEANANHYTTGTIFGHNVVIAHMPEYGKGSSAKVAANIRHTFPDITLALIVGICGGVPNAQGNEIMLGDVIIGNSVVEYDRGRQLPDGG